MRASGSSLQPSGPPASASSCRPRPPGRARPPPPPAQNRRPAHARAGGGLRRAAGPARALSLHWPGNVRARRPGLRPCACHRFCAIGPAATTREHICGFNRGFPPGRACLRDRAVTGGQACGAGRREGGGLGGSWQQPGRAARRGRPSSTTTPTRPRAPVCSLPAAPGSAAAPGSGATGLGSPPVGSLVRPAGRACPCPTCRVR